MKDLWTDLAYNGSGTNGVILDTFRAVRMLARIRLTDLGIQTPISPQ